MGMIVNGLNRIRDLLSTLITDIEAGTGTNQETAEDIDLQTPITGTELDIESTTNTTQQFVDKAIITTADGTGETITEVIWKTASPEKAISRITHDGIAHDAESDLIYETRWFVKGRFG
jgi:hypothetical protein